MERPRCKTCPYWDTEDFHAEYEKSDLELTHDQFLAQCLENGEVIDGECRRYPRTPSDDGKEYLGANSWPRTSDYDWCGEHPDFPAYLRSLKDASPVDDSQDDKIDFSGWPVRERKVLLNVKISKWNQLGEQEVTYLKIETWSQLANLTVGELAAQHGCGPFTRSGIVARLEARGLHLRRNEESAECLTAPRAPA